MPWIDVHTHLNFLEVSPEQAIEQGQGYGVERYITIGTEPEDHQIVLDLAEKLFPVVACTLGVHPHEAQKLSPEVVAFIEKKCGQKEVVAIGEIGLDYFYNNTPHEVQRQAFRRQLEIAENAGLPVEIHTRDAEADTAEILAEFGGKIRGILHCFTGTKDLAKKALDLGLDISISGIVTFKKAEELRDVVRFVPVERLHVETDAPFLAPIPHRGEKNVPAYVIHTAQAVANLKGVSMDELSERVRQNAERTFPKLVWN